MAPLKLSFAVVALLLASPARADPVARWQQHVAEASARFGVPADWIERVIRAESGGRTMLGGRPITSHAGAMGLMQLMPGTWTEVRAQLRLGADPHNPRDNILAGTAYLRMMYDRFGHPGMFAAYNAGPDRYAAYLAGRSRLPGETVAYVQMITGESHAPVLKRSVDRLTAARAPEPISKRPSGSGPNSDSIFFIRRPAL
jgi:soluble lytic murein transglycosylase-like protein